MSLHPKAEDQQPHDPVPTILDYDETVRSFLPRVTPISEASRALVPILCSLFSTHDDLYQESLLPWDAMGGVIATLFAILTVDITYYGGGKNIVVHDPRTDVSTELLRLRFLAAVNEETEGDGSSSNSGVYEEFNLHPHIENMTLDLSAFEGIRGLEANFLHGHVGKAIDFGSALGRVTELPDNFLAENESILVINIDARGLDNVTAICDSFLERCKALPKLDLSPLQNVVSIGCEFLSWCSSLETVDLSPFSQVTSIGDSLLSHCLSLTAVDLTPLRNLITINASYWLCRCAELRGVIDLTAFRGLQKVEWYAHDLHHKFLWIYPEGRKEVVTPMVTVRVPCSPHQDDGCEELITMAVRESMKKYQQADLIKIEECAADEAA